MGMMAGMGGWLAGGMEGLEALNRKRDCGRG